MGEKKKAQNSKKVNVLEKIKNLPKKYKIIAGGVAAAIVIIIIIVAILSAPVSKTEAAEIFAGMDDRYNTAFIDAKNSASILDVSGLRDNAKKMIEVIDENIKLVEETKWPEGLGQKEKRLSGEALSEMDLYAQELATHKEFYQRIVDAADNEVLSIYEKDRPYGLYDVELIRKKLGLPSAASEKSKYHEFTDDEISEKLQESAIEITLGGFNIDCRTSYGYTMCDSSMDVAVRNKSDINFTNGGSVDITAYDQSGNPITSDTFYIGNRLEKGQTAKQKLFQYIRDEHRADFQNNPTFKVTKVQIYNY